MEDRDRAGILLEVVAVELARRPEHALKDVVQLEIGLHLFLAEVVLRLADLLLVITIVPRLDRDLVAELVGERLLVGDFFLHARDGGRPDPHHQVHRLVRRLGHRVLHPPMGVSLETEQPGAVGAELHDLGDRRVGVVGVAIVAAVDERTPDLLAERAVVGEGQDRIDRRARVDDGIFAGAELALLRRRQRRVLHVLRERHSAPPQ